MICIFLFFFYFFFFSSRRRHTRLVSDWSSDVCSSDLVSSPQPWSWARPREIPDPTRRSPSPGRRTAHPPRSRDVHSGFEREGRKEAIQRLIEEEGGGAHASLARGIHPRVQRDLLPTLTAQHQEPRPFLLRERGRVRYRLREEPLRPLEHVLGGQCDGGGVRHGSER